MNKCPPTSGEVPNNTSLSAMIMLKDRIASHRRLRLRIRLVLLTVLALALLGGAGMYGHYWWRTGRFLVSTDDAYVDVDSVLISPEVSGYIVSVDVRDNQKVQAGQVLARIDSRLYDAAVKHAQADVQAAEAGIDSLRQQILAQRILVQKVQASVQADAPRQQYGRYATLTRSGAAALQASQQWQAQIRESGAPRTGETAAVAVARQQIAVLEAGLEKALATLRRDQATLDQTDLDLGYTTIRAPIAGTVGDRTLRVGQYVQAGTQLMAVVPLSAVFVTANYKETDLTDVHPGQKVTIAVDAFPGVVVHERVNSIAPASGKEVALLPPDNATGNFTKIVQRVPVKIAIDPHDPLLGSLRPGGLVEPTIDTRNG